MKGAGIALISCLILTVPVTPQELSPDVLLLARVKRHVEEESKRLANVSCLETVFREHKPKNGRMKPLDTVRLEVLTDGTKELYASPGDRKFSENPPIAWAGSGTLGNGFFGLYLHTVFLSGNISYSWKGYEDVAGRRLAHWDYRLPLMSSGQTFVLPEGSGAVSLRGSFFADPGTAEVVRLDVAAGDFPPTLPLASAEWTIDYAPAAAGGNLSVLLPQTAEFHMVRFSGETDHDRFAFTQCHSFSAESTLSFDTPDTSAEPPRFAASAVDDTLRPLPAGLEIPVKLTTRIAGGMAVGSLIDGVVPKDVLLKGQVAIPAGSAVRGRIRRLERYNEPAAYFVVAIEYTEVSIQGLRYRFDAGLTRIDLVPGVRETLSVPVSGNGVADSDLRAGAPNGAVAGRETIQFSELPGVATFFFTGPKLDLREGFQTVWNTGRKPGRGRR